MLHKNIKINNNSQQINISDLPNGFYIMILCVDDIPVSQEKLLINR